MGKMSDIDITRQEMAPQMPFDFDGATYAPEFDQSRLTGQMLRVYDILKLENWETLDEIAATTGDPQQSISARIRDLRKPRFGSHTIDRRRRGDPKNGLFEYRMKRL